MSDRDNFIGIRARRGTALESVAASQKANGEGMKDLVHKWAEAHVSGNLSAGPVGMKPKGRNKL